MHPPTPFTPNGFWLHSCEAAVTWAFWYSRKNPTASIYFSDKNAFRSQHCNNESITKVGRALRFLYNTAKLHKKTHLITQDISQNVILCLFRVLLSESEYLMHEKSKAKNMFLYMCNILYCIRYFNITAKVDNVDWLHWHIGPYFNGLKRKWEAPNASSFVGGSMAMLLFYRRINYSCAWHKSKKGWSEVT